jgi:hypothetical protein
MFELPVLSESPPLTDQERAVYGWQFEVGGFGEKASGG